MKERPILFNGPMVRALLAGQKTQTRRIVKPQPSGFDYGCCKPFDDRLRPINNPYGRPGDRLWVRETWAEVGTCDPGLIVYRADYPTCVPKQYENVPPASGITWKPSIHMFRRHSRITLEIVSVRVERLQDISEADAIAEGVEQDSDGWCDYLMPSTQACGSAYDSYRTLWESINGAGSWEANPWLWVVEFRRLP